MTINELFTKGARANIHELADVWLDICTIHMDGKSLKMCEELHNAIRASVTIPKGDVEENRTEEG